MFGCAFIHRSAWKGNSQKFAKNDALKGTKFIANSSLQLTLYSGEHSRREKKGQMDRGKALQAFYVVGVAEPGSKLGHDIQSD
jgi:hypothetical protein